MNKAFLQNLIQFLFGLLMTLILISAIVGIFNNLINK